MGHSVDRAGRKRLYGVELAIVIVATFGVIQASDGLMVQSGDTLEHSMDIYSWLTWWRSLLGFGIGAEVRDPLLPTPCYRYTEHARQLIVKKYPLSAVITAE